MRLFSQKLLRRISATGTHVGLAEALRGCRSARNADQLINTQKQHRTEFKIGFESPTVGTGILRCLNRVGTYEYLLRWLN
jgi:hypothetical protein